MIVETIRQNGTSGIFRFSLDQRSDEIVTRKIAPNKCKRTVSTNVQHRKALHRARQASRALNR